MSWGYDDFLLGHKTYGRRLGLNSIAKLECQMLKINEPQLTKLAVMRVVPFEAKVKYKKFCRAVREIV